MLNVCEFHSAFKRTRELGKKVPALIAMVLILRLEAVITAKLLQLTKKQLHATQPRLSYQALRIPFS